MSLYEEAVKDLEELKPKIEQLEKLTKKQTTTLQPNTTTLEAALSFHQLQVMIEYATILEMRIEYLKAVNKL